MKLVQYKESGVSKVGKVVGESVVDLTARMGVATMIEAIQRLQEIRLRDDSGVDASLNSIDFLPVVQNASRILCVGLNYRSHVIETGREVPSHPMIFVRFASSQVGHWEPMVRPKESEMFDYEGELAVVIGKACRRVSPKDAPDMIAGYSAYNDGSVRDWQRHTIQFTPGKNFPQTGAFGPWLVTTDELPDIAASHLVTRLNGVEVQRAVISDLIFGVPELISYCSTFTSLEPGDVIVTGTTGGVGHARTPPLWMKPGDVVEVEIGGIGTLVNPIVGE
jgi:2-keto-4-pentenoate hydratase/2-oxohepta-3-ene-1,7-dioic acid hydratase in catechol pathway